jgi:hypothetical protein
MSGPAERFLTRKLLVEFLRERGFPISVSTMAKLAMPSRGEGPPCEGVWGNRALYDPNKALRWARARFRATPGKAA